MNRFYSISQNEMNDFLFPQGFQLIKIDGTRELVYAKIVRVSNLKLSLRVYSGINPDGHSREKGSDAIRVQLFYMLNGQPKPIGRSQKCLRVQTWQKNLQKAINKHADNNHFKICKCGAPLVIRTRKSDKQEFWGCVTWAQTGCNGKENTSVQEIAPETTKTAVNNTKTAVNNKFQIPKEKISSEQLEAQEAFLTTDQHLMLGARAGGGKTTLLRHLASFNKYQTTLMLAFNRKNAKEGREKLPKNVTSLTTHAFCTQILKNYIDLPEKPDGSKNAQILEDVYPSMQNNDRKRIRKAAFQLIGLAKNFACMPDDLDSIYDVLRNYDIFLDSDDEERLVVEITSDVLKLSLPGKKFGSIYDFDDMLWLPTVLDLQAPKTDCLFADECQDFNACQIILLKRMAANGTRVVAVGDPYQAVYRFRGADCDAYYNVLKALPNCREILLTTNYRSGSDILQYVRENTHVKDIFPAPNAIKGNVELDLDYEAVLDLLTQQFSPASVA